MESGGVSLDQLRALGGCAVETGTYTGTSDNTDMTINFGVTPKLVLIWGKFRTDSSHSNEVLLLATPISPYCMCVGSTSYAKYSGYCEVSWNGSKGTFTHANFAGETYTYIAIY